MDKEKKPTKKESRWMSPKGIVGVTVFAVSKQNHKMGEGKQVQRCNEGAELSGV